MATQEIPKEVMAVGIETLRDDMQQLTDDFQELMSSIGHRGKSGFIAGKERIRSFVRSFSEGVRGKLSNACRRVSGYSRQTVEKSRKAIAARPFTVLFTVLTAGLIAGIALRRVH